MIRNTLFPCTAPARGVDVTLSVAPGAGYLLYVSTCFGLVISAHRVGNAAVPRGGAATYTGHISSCGGSALISRAGLVRIGDPVAHARTTFVCINAADTAMMSALF